MLPRKQRRGDEREREREREALSRSALDLWEAKLIPSARPEGVWELPGERAFPAETWDEAELWTAPRERDCGRPAPPGFRLFLESPAAGVLPSPGLRPPNPGKSSYDPCLNVPEGAAALLPLAPSGKRVSGSGKPVFVDYASLVKKEKF